MSDGKYKIEERVALLEENLFEIKKAIKDIEEKVDCLPNLVKSIGFLSDVFKGNSFKEFKSGNSMNDNNANTMKFEVNKAFNSEIAKDGTLHEMKVDGDKEYNMDRENILSNLEKINVIIDDEMDMKGILGNEDRSTGTETRYHPSKTLDGEGHVSEMKVDCFSDGVFYPISDNVHSFAFNESPDLVDKKRNLESVSDIGVKNNVGSNVADCKSGNCDFSWMLSY